VPYDPIYQFQYHIGREVLPRRAEGSKGLQNRQKNEYFKFKKKTVFLSSINFKLLTQIQGNSVLVAINVKGEKYDYSFQVPINLAT